MTRRRVTIPAATANGAKIKRLAHNIKGEGGSFGFDPLSEIGAELERSASEANAEASRKLALRQQRHDRVVLVVLIAISRRARRPWITGVAINRLERMPRPVRYKDGMKVIGIAGWSGAGKTTLLTRVIPCLTARGLRVSTIKHAHHNFDFDKPGKDSHAHRMAGATEVLVGSSSRWAIVHELRQEAEPTLLSKGGVETIASWTKRPAERPEGVESPMPLGTDGGADDRIVQLCFIERDPRTVWDSFRQYGKTIDAGGVGHVTFAAPFFPTDVGTDRYTDQLW